MWYQMNTKSDFAEEYTNAERILLVVFGILIGGIIVFVFKVWIFPWYQYFVLTAHCKKILGIEGLTINFYGLFVGLPLFNTLLIAATFGRRGYKILQEDQTPPSKEKVTRPTQIQRGIKARLIGYMHILCVFPLLALAIWGYFQAEEMSNRPTPKNKSCTINAPNKNSVMK